MDKKYDLRELIQRTYDNIPCDSKQEKAAVMAKIFDVEGKVDLSGNGAYRRADIVSLIETAVETNRGGVLTKVPSNLEQMIEISPSNSLKQTVKEIICYGIIPPTIMFSSIGVTLYSCSFRNEPPYQQVVFALGAFGAFLGSVLVDIGHNQLKEQRDARLKQQQKILENEAIETKQLPSPESSALQKVK